MVAVTEDQVPVDTDGHLEPEFQWANPSATSGSGSWFPTIRMSFNRASFNRHTPKRAGGFLRRAVQHIKRVLFRHHVPRRRIARARRGRGQPRQTGSLCLPLRVLPPWAGLRDCPIAYVSSDKSSRPQKNQSMSKVPASERPWWRARGGALTLILLWGGNASALILADFGIWWTIGLLIPLYLCSLANLPHSRWRVPLIVFFVLSCM